jgi:hypothetical protein
MNRFSDYARFPFRAMKRRGNAVISEWIVLAYYADLPQQSRHRREGFMSGPYYLGPRQTRLDWEMPEEINLVGFDDNQIPDED